MKPRYYLSGGMSGHPDLNFPLFHAVTDILRRSGREIVNPAEITTDPDASWHDCMRADIAELVKCTGIMMLPGWQTSRGARLEHHIATALGMTVEFVAVQTWPEGSGSISIALGSYQEFNETREAA